MQHRLWLPHRRITLLPWSLLLRPDAAPFQRGPQADRFWFLCALEPYRGRARDRRLAPRGLQLFDVQPPPESLGRRRRTERRPHGPGHSAANEGVPHASDGQGFPRRAVGYPSMEFRGSRRRDSQYGGLRSRSAGHGGRVRSRGRGRAIRALRGLVPFARGACPRA